MRALTFQAPGEVAVRDVPEPRIGDAEDALVRVESSGVCGSDLHLYHGRVKIEPGFVLGHELVGTVTAVGDGVRSLAPGDRVLSCFHTACGRCFFCLRGAYHRCLHGRTFGHGAALGNLPGAQAEQVLVPNAEMTLRRVPAGMSDDVALFAGDVMGTGYHATASAEVTVGDTVAVLGLGPVGLCAVQAARAAGAAQVFAVDSVPERLAMAERFGATPLHLEDDDVKEVVRTGTEGRGADAVIDAVGDPRALELALFLVRAAGTVSVVGVYAERCEVHMGLAWIKGITMRMGLANVIGHVDRVLAMMSAGRLDPGPLVTPHRPLEDGPEAYALFDRREALKIVLQP
ncbi:MAG: alcohol dehydrogenase catalytic domain-containing protein [Acidobacteriota bacterium]|nr:alcohol dehydrogenase catalytic domain-containing protein [Acidobacteriota bacterium]